MKEYQAASISRLAEGSSEQEGGIFQVFYRGGRGGSGGGGGAGGGGGCLEVL